MLRLFPSYPRQDDCIVYCRRIHSDTCCMYYRLALFGSTLNFNFRHIEYSDTCMEY